MPPKKRKQWSTENMKQAISAVRSKQMGLFLASKRFDVPKSTLKDKVKSNEEDINKLVFTKLGRKPTLDKELEDALVTYCLEMETRFYGLTAKDIKKMAFQLAERNGVQHPFSKQDETAGWKWLRSFMKRHPRLSLRKPQATSLKRITGFSKENVKTFFDLYEPLYKIVKNSPNRLYNCDETGLTIVQHKTSKVISLRGKRQVGAISSAERGSLVTMVTCMSATGHYIPPLLVFPRKNMKAELLDGAPNGSTAACHKSGWIEAESFLKWFKEQFLANVKPTKDDPVVLILDGHYSHTRNLPLLELARDNGVHIISLPPHCSHKMQPLDRAFMAPFKTYYAQTIETWLKQNIYRAVSHYQIAKLLGEAYNKAATVATAENGFRKTGLFPLNRNIFEDYEFVALEATSNSELDIQQSAPSGIPSTVVSDDNQQPGPSNTQRRTVATIQQAASTNIHQKIVAEDSGSSSPHPSGSPKIMPVHISPLPSIKAKTHSTKGRGRPSRPAAIITSSPYKDQLSQEITEKERKKEVKANKTVKRNINSKAKAPPKSTKGKKKKAIESSSESSEEEADNPLTVSTDEQDSDDDCECPYCNQSYSTDKQGESWIRCIKCHIWCHEACSGSDDFQTFVCEFCLEG